MKMNGLIIFILCNVAIICTAIIVGGLCGASLKSFMREDTLMYMQRYDPSCFVPYAIAVLIIYVVAAYYLWNSKLMLPGKGR
jgi:F0F1-type ATP synthase membrane subunit c/vacuolar-type H+-ATPase subunit K